MARFVRFAVILYLFQAMEALGYFDRVIYGSWTGKTGDKLTQALNLLLIVCCVWLFGQGFRRARAAGVGMGLVIAVSCYLLFSVAWSVDPPTTIRRGIEYVFVVVGAVGVAGCCDDDEFMEMLLLTCGITAVASIVLVAVNPNDAIMIEPPGWRGILSHKNGLGQVMAVGVLACLHSIRTGSRKRLRNLAMLLIFIVVAVKSQSTTSLLAIAAFLAMDRLAALLSNGGIGRILGIALLVLFVPIAAVAAIAPGALLELIGKDPTLTGRTELWAYVWAAIDQRPVLGWGYSAFWSPNDPVAVEINTVLQWYIPQAHNGLLEIMLNAGMFGAAAFIFLWLRNTWLALRAMRTPARAVATSALLCNIGIALIGVSETVMVEPFQIITTLFFVFGLICEIAVRTAPRQRHASVPRAVAVGAAARP